MRIQQNYLQKHLKMSKTAAWYCQPIVNKQKNGCLRDTLASPQSCTFSDLKGCNSRPSLFCTCLNFFCPFFSFNGNVFHFAHYILCGLPQMECESEGGGEGHEYTCTASAPRTEVTKIHTKSMNRSIKAPFGLQ